MRSQKREKTRSLGTSKGPPDWFFAVFSQASWPLCSPHLVWSSADPFSNPEPWACTLCLPDQVTLAHSACCWGCTHTVCQASFIPLLGPLQPATHWWASEHTRSWPTINQSISVRRQCSNPRQHSLLKGSQGNWVTVSWASLILSSFLLGISRVSWVSLRTALIWYFHCDSTLF